MGFSLLHITANTLGWYYAYTWIDIPMHILGGVFVAWVAIAYHGRIRGYKDLSAVMQVLGVIAVVALVGVLWELWEAFLDAYRIYAAGAALPDIVGAFQLAPYNDRWDTLFDLVNDIVGALATTAVWQALEKNKE